MQVQPGKSDEAIAAPSSEEGGLINTSKAAPKIQKLAPIVKEQLLSKFGNALTYDI